MKAEDRKKHILECSKHLFSTRGYYKTQISDIVEKAKIARGTIYRYFKNKDDIFISLLDTYYMKWEKAISLEASDIDLKTIHPEEFLRHRIRSTLLFFGDDHELCNLILRMGPGLPGILESSVERFETKIVHQIMDDLILGKNNHHIMINLNIELMANLLVGSILRVAFFLFGKNKQEKNAKYIDKVTEEIVRLFSPGLFQTP